MGLFSRLGDIVNSNINAMLDTAENPEKMARLVIKEMEDTLVEVRMAAARAMADRKEMAREVEHYERSAAEWEEKAELAIDRGRDDLARGALQAKQRALSEADRRHNAMSAAEDALAKRQEDLAKLEEKLSEAKAKHRSLAMRREAAEHSIRVRSQLHDDKVDAALQRYAGVERKVDELEAYADSIKPAAPSLEAEFAALQQDEEIENELAALKRRRGSADGEAG